MLKKLTQNYKKYISYSRYYFIGSAILFLIFGNGEIESFEKRAGIVFGILIGYLLFFNFTGFIIGKTKSINKYNWKKTKKIVNFQLNFFFYFGLVGLVLTILNCLANPRGIPFALLTSNVVLGMMIGTLKSKYLYIYENEEL